MGELRIVEQVLGRADRRERQAAQLRSFENLLGGQVRGPAVEHRVDLLGVLAANVEILPLLARELGAEATLRQPADECRPITDQADHHVAVAAAAGAEDPRPVNRSATNLDPSLAVPCGASLLERPRHGLLQAHIDRLASAAALAL